MRKLLFILIIIIGLIGLAFWSPWYSWNYNWFNLIGIDNRDKFSGLKILSLQGEMEVYLDGEKVGTADESGFLEVFPVEPGEHELTLTREDDFYIELVKKLNFEEETDVVVAYDLGPTEDFSEGHILSARKSFTADRDPLLEIISVEQGVNVNIDGSDYGTTPIRSLPISADRQHKVTLTKAGYESLEIVIFPDSQEERNKLKDLILTLEVNLFLQPVELRESVNGDN